MDTQKKTYLFTSESVSCGHPDKVCDQISDTILDMYLSMDPDSKVAIECFITSNLLVIGGEVYSNAHIDHIAVAKSVLMNIGYNKDNGFDVGNAVYINAVHKQSQDIRDGVDRDLPEEQGAGDQGIVFGYACDETIDRMPLPITLANYTMMAYDTCRMFGVIDGCRPDAKCQYTVVYDAETNTPIKIDTIVISMQHDDHVTQSMLREYFTKKILMMMLSIRPDLRKFFTDIDSIRILINPTGKFVVGGPEGDTGLTGRKIIVDTYGGRCQHGGGAFSGKDPSKVDRSAAYMARYAAKSMVDGNYASEITIQVSYAIGVAKPISIYVKARGSKYSDSELAEIVKKNFDFSPYGIEKALGLKKPIYQKTATYGHFGHNTTSNMDEIHPWERDRVIHE